jgi:hypothetical protein
MSKKFKLPKYKKGDKVTTPDAVNQPITALMWSNGRNWYEVNGKWYSETEIHP